MQQNDSLSREWLAGPLHEAARAPVSSRVCACSRRSLDALPVENTEEQCGGGDALQHHVRLRHRCLQPATEAGRLGRTPDRLGRWGAAAYIPDSLPQFPN